MPARGGRGRRLAARLDRARRLRPGDWRHLAVAAAELLRARRRIARTPAARLLEELRQPASAPVSAEPVGITPEQVAWAVRTAARLVPWRADCLVQALAAQRWLTSERQPTALFIGVHKGEGGRFEAHAWLRCGTVTVTGGNVDRFTPLLVPPGK